MTNQVLKYHQHFRQNRNIKVKVGDKVSKGDLILNISTSNQSIIDRKIIPKDTENLITEAENALKKIKKKIFKLKKKKNLK